MRFLVASVLLLVLSGCYWRVVDEPRWERRINDEDFSRVVITYATKMRNENDLTLEDSKVYYTYKAHSIKLVFSSQKNYGICEARELLVDVVEGFLKSINEEVVLYDQLSNYPFTANNLEVYIIS